MMESGYVRQSIKESLKDSQIVRNHQPGTYYSDSDTVWWPLVSRENPSNFVFISPSPSHSPSLFVSLCTFLSLLLCQSPSGPVSLSPSNPFSPLSVCQYVSHRSWQMLCKYSECQRIHMDRLRRHNFLFIANCSHACTRTYTHQMIKWTIYAELSLNTNTYPILPLLPLSPLPLPPFLAPPTVPPAPSTQTHLACAPDQQREVPGGGDPSQWQRRSAAASRTAMCGSVSAFGDDLVSQSVIHTGANNIWWSHRVDW